MSRRFKPASASRLSAKLNSRGLTCLLESTAMTVRVGQSCPVSKDA